MHARNVVWMCAVTAVLAICGGGVGRAAPTILTPTPDESSMERVIEQYLKDAHQLTAREEVLEDNDLVLTYKMEGDAVPDFTITVDTQAVNKADDGTVRERAVTALVYTGVKVPDAKAAAVLEVMSGFARDNWFFSGYIDEDREVAVQWNVNVMAQGLDAEYVFDMLARLYKTWEKLSPLVAAALQ